jgi:type II secretory pathway component PulL
MNIIHYSKIGEFSQEILENAKDVIIAIDSHSFSAHSVTLPRMSHSKAVKAIPYALESKLLDDVDLLKFVITKSLIQNTWDVLVISKEILNEIEKQLLKVKCRPVAILPDFMLLPFSEGSVNYCEKEGFITFRSNDNKGGCLESKIFHTLFIDSNLVKADFSYSAKPKVNIQISSSQEGLSHYLGLWRTPIVIALIVILLAVFQIWLKNNELYGQLSEYKINNEKQFRNLFPDVERIVNIRVQTKQQLSKALEKDIIYQNDLLTKLSSEVFPNSQVSKIIFSNQKLTVEVSK